MAAFFLAAICVHLVWPLITRSTVLVHPRSGSIHRVEQQPTALIPIEERFRNGEPFQYLRTRFSGEGASGQRGSFHRAGSQTLGASVWSFAEHVAQSRGC